MTKIAKFQYKCRLCGAIEENPCMPVGDALVNLLHALWKDGAPSDLKLPGNPVDMTNIHPCGDGNCGVSDLIGYKVMEE